MKEKWEVHNQSNIIVKCLDWKIGSKFSGSPTRILRTLLFLVILLSTLIKTILTYSLKSISCTSIARLSISLTYRPTTRGESIPAWSIRFISSKQQKKICALPFILPQSTYSVFILDYHNSSKYPSKKGSI